MRVAISGECTTTPRETKSSIGMEETARGTKRCLDPAGHPIYNWQFRLVIQKGTRVQQAAIQTSSVKQVYCVEMGTKRLRPNLYGRGWSPELVWIKFLFSQIVRGPHLQHFRVIATRIVSSHHFLSILRANSKEKIFNPIINSMGTRPKRKNTAVDQLLDRTKSSAPGLLRG